MLKYILLIPVVLIFITNCKKQSVNTQSVSTIEETTEESIKTDQINNQEDKLPEDLSPFERYYGMMIINSPDGKRLRAYVNETEETPWGPVSSPILYLYDKDKNVLNTYTTLEMIAEDFWVGNIDVTYNKERNSFDMIFSLDASGNYGTGYIDLNTNKYIRELERIPMSEEEKLMWERQGLPD